MRLVLDPERGAVRLWWADAGHLRFVLDPERGTVRLRSVVDLEPDSVRLRSVVDPEPDTARVLGVGAVHFRSVVDPEPGTVHVRWPDAGPHRAGGPPGGPGPPIPLRDNARGGRIAP